MKLIGRKLIMDFGQSHVGIEIIPKSASLYKIPEGCGGLLVDIYDFLGERIEKIVGTPSGNPYGYDLNSCVPGYNKLFWVTEEEYNGGTLKDIL